MTIRARASCLATLLLVGCGDPLTEEGFRGAPLYTLSIPVTERFALRVEGGPVTQLRSVARVDNGAESGAERVSRLTWWAGLGLGVHL